MADDALDAESLRRDRDRYHGFLLQAEQQLADCNERIQQLHQAIDALDRLLALTADGHRAGVAPARGAPNGAARPARGDGSGREPQEDAAPPAPPTRRRAAPKRRSRSWSPAAPAPPATATPAAPEPVEPPGPPAAGSAAAARSAAAGDPPKGTDALRLVLESDPTRTWSLAELLDALGARGWLPSSRRPEEGVRISLKRLAERGGAVRDADGRWRHPGADGTPPNGIAPGAEAPGPLTVAAPPPGADEPSRVEAPSPDDAAEPPGAAAPARAEAVDPSAPPATPSGDDVAASAAKAPPRDDARQEPAPEPRQPAPPPRRPASFGLPVGGTVTEL